MNYNSSFLSRRAFLRNLTAGAALTVLPAHVLGRAAPPPSGKLHIACIGAAGRGGTNLQGVRSENIVALCDVDQNRAGEASRKFPRAQLFTDFRRMFDKIHRSLDAVVVSTPDHTHAVAVMAALHLGKHVYCEKPLAHNLFEARQITLAARKYRVATQLGNQGHSYDHIRLFCEWIWDGAIGPVREVHAACSSAYVPRSYRTRPPDTPPVPDTLDWDLWLGPAPYRPYHPTYHPGIWRRWVPFGTGVIGDWTCHVIDPVFWALDLGSPVSVLAHAREYDDPAVRAETYPPGSIIEYRFPARGKRPPVKVTWYDGACKLPRPTDLESDRQVPGIGAIVIGDQGKIMYGSHGASGCRLFPEEKMKAYKRPPQSIPRSKGHYRDWINACKGGPAAGSNFDYGGPLAEVALLGCLALRFNGQKLNWDGPSLRVTNLPSANEFIHPPYRKGWYL